MGGLFFQLQTLHAAASWAWWSSGWSDTSYNGNIFQTDANGDVITDGSGNPLFSTQALNTGQSEVTNTTPYLSATTGYRDASSATRDLGYNSSSQVLNFIFGYYHSARAGTSATSNTTINLNADMYVNRLGFANNTGNNDYVTTITTNNDSTIYMGKESAGDGFCYRAWNTNANGTKGTFDVNFSITPLYGTAIANTATAGNNGGAIFRLGGNSLTIGSAGNTRYLEVNASADNRAYNFVYMVQYSGQKQVFDINAQINSTYANALHFYAGTADAKCIVNFKGDGDNRMVNAVFDCGIFNLMKNAGYNSMVATLSFRYDSIVNVLTEGTLNGTTSMNAGGPHNGVSGTINLCGGSAEFNSNLNMNSTTQGGRRINIDFGMTRSGMTETEMLAQGIVNPDTTGKNKDQTLYMKNITGIGEAYISTSYVTIMNFYSNKFGSDEIIIGSNHTVDDSVLANNFIRIDIDPYQQILDDYYGVGIYDLEYGKDETYGYWIVKEAITGGQYDGMFQYDLAFNAAVEALFAPIPEPSTVAAILGLAALAFVAYRRKK